MNNEICNKLKENIELTIGVTYELLVFNNRIENKSICEVYNTGVKNSKYEILCFLHEDIIFKTKNWGGIILGYYQNSEIGLLGVAGSYYYSLSPVGWFGTNEKEMNILLNTKSTNNEAKLLYQTRNPNKMLSEVAVIDGVFMSTRKNIFNSVSFSEDLLTSFHGYDIDLSLQIFQTNKKIVVTKEITIEHFSNGTLDQNWFNAMTKIAKKWKHLLPVFTPIYTNSEIKYLNKESLWNFYISTGHLMTKSKRLKIYFYYAIKQSLLFFSIYKLLKSVVNKITTYK